jgi:hypothetical protein
MINIGNIVYLKRRGGSLLTDRTVRNKVGLVIKEYKEKGAIPQYEVQFNQDIAKWYYQHDLSKIQYERD